MTIGDLTEAMADPLWYKNVKGVGPKTAEELLAKLEKCSVLASGPLDGTQPHKDQTEN